MKRGDDNPGRLLWLLLGVTAAGALALAGGFAWLYRLFFP